MKLRIIVDVYLSHRDVDKKEIHNAVYHFNQLKTI